MEKDLLEEEEEVGVTVINLMGLVAVAVVVALERLQVEFGMMGTTFASSVNQGNHPDPAAAV